MIPASNLFFFQHLVSGQLLAYLEAETVFLSEKESTMTQTEKVIYTAKVHATGGRDGASRSDDGGLDIKDSTPGTPGTGANPEQPTQRARRRRSSHEA
jgi:hypothetical protein